MKADDLTPPSQEEVEALLYEPRILLVETNMKGESIIVVELHNGQRIPLAEYRVLVAKARNLKKVK